MLHRRVIAGLVALVLYGCGATPRQMVTPVTNFQGLQVRHSRERKGQK